MEKPIKKETTEAKQQQLRNNSAEIPPVEIGKIYLDFRNANAPQTALEIPGKSDAGQIPVTAGIVSRILFVESKRLKIASKIPASINRRRIKESILSGTFAKWFSSIILIFKLIQKILLLGHYNTLIPHLCGICRNYSENTFYIFALASRCPIPIITPTRPRTSRRILRTAELDSGALDEDCGRFRQSSQGSINNRR